MTPRGRPFGRQGKLATCVQCQGLIPEQKPVYLVGTPSGRIIGPFHSGCASHVVEQARRGFTVAGQVNAEQLGTWPSIREETLPE